MSPFWLDQRAPMLQSLAWLVLWMLSVHLISESIPHASWVHWGPALLWLIGFWIMMMGVGDIWRVDHQSGALDQWLSDPWVARSMIKQRLFAFTLLHVGGMLLVLPLLSWMFAISPQACLRIVLGWFAMLPSLWWIGGALSALTIGLKDRANLLVMVGFPLYFPGIFLSVMWVVGDLSFAEGLPWFCVMAGLFFTLAPTSILQALQIGVDG